MMNATQTIYNFTCGEADLKLTFTSPLLMNDLALMTRPVTYISFAVKSNDVRAHNAQLYLGASTTSRSECTDTAGKSYCSRRSHGSRCIKAAAALGRRAIRPARRTNRRRRTGNRRNQLAGPGAPSAPPANFQPKTQLAPPAPSKPTEVGNLATKMMQAFLPGVAVTPGKPAGSLTIGRANDNDIVIQDVLASRHHAFLVESPLGTEIRDAQASTAPSSTASGSGPHAQRGRRGHHRQRRPGLHRRHLIRRTEAATRTGGLEVNASTSRSTARSCWTTSR